MLLQHIKCRLFPKRQKSTTGTISNCGRWTSRQNQFEEDPRSPVVPGVCTLEGRRSHTENVLIYEQVGEAIAVNNVCKVIFSIPSHVWGSCESISAAALAFARLGLTRVILPGWKKGVIYPALSLFFSTSSWRVSSSLPFKLCNFLGDLEDVRRETFSSDRIKL